MQDIIHSLTEKEMSYLDEVKKYFNIKNLLSCLMYYEIGSAYLDDGESAGALEKIIDKAKKFENPLVYLLVEQIALSHELDEKEILFGERKRTFKYRPTEKQRLSQEKTAMAKKLRAEARTVNSLILRLDQLAASRNPQKGTLQQLSKYAAALDAIIKDRTQWIAKIRCVITRRDCQVEKKRRNNLKKALALLEKNIL